MQTENTRTSGRGDPSLGTRSHWLAWAFTALLWVVILLAYHAPVALVVESWANLPSHAHGYVVILVVAYLVWDKRKQLTGLAQAPSWAGIAALLLSGAAAFCGELVSAGVVVQFAVVFMLLSAVWVVMGDRYIRILFGPLSFLIFSIPFGHDILPTLMDWTANATVLGLRASGVPVFQQDRVFVIPSGSWSVVEACSGIRYLFTSLFIGSIFAYITYTRWQKRVIFVLWMLALSLLANWLRAYIIVMAAHLSNNQWGLGMSHLGFGWVVFAITVLVSFGVGVRWRDAELHTNQERSVSAVSAPARLTSSLAALSLLLVLGWSQGAHYLLNLPPRPAPVLDLSNALQGLVAVPASRQRIEPQFVGASALHDAIYHYKNGEISLVLAYYRNQRQGAKLVSVSNIIEPTHTWLWNKRERMASLGEGIPQLQLDYFSRTNAKAVVASVYWVGGQTTVSAVSSKFYQAFNLAQGKGDDGARLVISATHPDSAEIAQALLEDFIHERLPGLLADLDLTYTGPPQ